MPETIEKRGSVPNWHWDNVQRDLREQAGLEGVTIDPLGAMGGSRYGNIRFNASWSPNEYLLITMTEYSEELIQGFAKVVGYEPFCRYIDKYGFPTIEWDKVDPNGRFAALQQQQGVRNLVRFSS